LRAPGISGGDDILASNGCVVVGRSLNISISVQEETA